ncbi:MAG TPA: CsbD family protein, partial [Reyranella sp.]
MWEKIKGSWSQTKGAVKEQWGKLTDDDLLEIEGRRDQLVGKIQTRYGIT